MGARSEAGEPEVKWTSGARSGGGGARSGAGIPEGI